jgi:hypothetical protein
VALPDDWANDRRRRLKNIEAMMTPEKMAKYRQTESLKL